MATCKFGEDITRYVIGLYENRLEDRYDKKVSPIWRDMWFVICFVVNMLLIPWQLILY
jgi:hypothetical protein